MIKIYTDGSFRRPNHGAWATIIIHPCGRIDEFSAYVKDTTISRMELQAILEGLNNISPTGHVQVFTDSQYATLCIMRWIPMWEKNNWITSTNRPVANQDILMALSKKRMEFEDRLVVTWVRRNTTYYNKKCDTIVQKITRERAYPRNLT
jgi:ribonuclease HI